MTTSVIPPFEERVKQWSNPPVDDVGYLSSAEMYAYPAERLRLVIAQAERARYGGWRNHHNQWRKILRMNTTTEKYVLDYGCGIGIEALQYARRGNDVAVCDISKDNVRLAMRVLHLEGFNCDAWYLTEQNVMPYTSLKFDVIHCAGVLHHIPEPKPVVEEMAANLIDHGELRLMIYSDEAWRFVCGTEPPEVVEDSPQFEKYWKHWDAVGGYADWYNAERLSDRFGEWFELIDYGPVTQHGEYVAAVLRKR